MLPNFLIIGATKCGTTSLHRYLTEHPEVFIHPVKELRFFTEEHNWHRGPSWYRAQFSTAAAAAVGEASNAYTRNPLYDGVPQRIHRLLPDVRLIYLVRHPIERIESHYRHRLVTGLEWRSPEDAVRQDPRYIAASRYGHQLRQYLRHFRSEQILVLRFERLVSAPGATLRRLCDFLGVGEAPGVELPRLNSTAERPVAPERLRRLARFPSMQGWVKRASNLLRRSPLHRYLQSAEEPPFAPSPGLHAEFVEIFRADKALLAELAGESFDDWDLEAPPLSPAPAER